MDEKVLKNDMLLKHEDDELNCWNIFAKMIFQLNFSCPGLPALEAGRQGIQLDIGLVMDTLGGLGPIEKEKQLGSV